MVLRADRHRRARRGALPGGRAPSTSPSLYVPGVALVALAVGAAAWVAAGRDGGAASTRQSGAAHAWSRRSPIRCASRCASGMLPPPGGELIEPLLGWPVPIAGRWSRRVRINVRFSRRGRRVLEPGRLVIRDPLRLCSRELVGRGRGGGARAAAGRARDRPGGGGAGAGEHGGSGHRAGRAGPAPRRLARPSSRSTGCGPTARARRRRASTGPRWPARGEMLERRLVAELDSAPLVVLDPLRARSEEDARHGRARRGLALRAPGARRRLRGPAARRPPPDRGRRTTWAPGRRCTCASRWWRPARRRPRGARPARRGGALGHRRRPEPRAARARAPPGRRRAVVVAAERAARCAARCSRSPAAPAALVGARGGQEGGGVSPALAAPPTAGARRRRGARGRPRRRDRRPLRRWLPIRLASFSGARRVRRRPLGGARRQPAARAHAARGRSSRSAAPRLLAARHGAERRACSRARSAVAGAPRRADRRLRAADRLRDRLGLAAAGLPLRLLAPGNWNELGGRPRPRPRGRPGRSTGPTTAPESGFA